MALAGKIFTHSEAAGIVELFEDILIQHNICVPSPEDDERGEDNMIGLYGSTYSDLLDVVEEVIIDLTKEAAGGAEIVTDTFNDSCGIDLKKDKMWEAWAEAQDVRQEMIERGEILDE